MNKRALFQMGVLASLAVALWLIFPSIAIFAEGAALSVRRFWWLILGVVFLGGFAWIAFKTPTK